MTAADLDAKIAALCQAEALAEGVRVAVMREANPQDAADPWYQVACHLARGYCPAIAALRALRAAMGAGE